jgi:hypothetical protein
MTIATLIMQTMESAERRGEPLRRIMREERPPSLTAVKLPLQNN